jgi:hypothetical protein
MTGGKENGSISSNVTYVRNVRGFAPAQFLNFQRRSLSSDRPAHKFRRKYSALALPLSVSR